MSTDGGREDDDLTTPHGLDYVDPGDRWDEISNLFYFEDLSECERLYRNTSNPLYVWLAIQRFGKLWPRFRHLCLPDWILHYLVAGANGVHELRNLQPAKAVERIPQALGLRAGKGKNYFLGLRADERNMQAARLHAQVREARRDGKAVEAVGVALTAKASKRVRARLAAEGDSSISERAVRRAVATGRSLTTRQRPKR